MRNADRRGVRNSGRRPMVVAFENIGLTYEDGAEVLRSVNFSLKDGEFRFLTGPSGAGKTSLLKLIYLALKPTKGRLTLFGEDVTDAPRETLPALRRRIGVVFQEFRLLNHLTAFENVSLPMRIAGVNQAHYREDVSELLNWVGLGDRMHAPPQTLSGGEKQRVALARALVSKPDLILADEPTGNVDPEMGEKIMKLFVELNRLGAAVVIATHDIHLVEALGKKSMRLDNGRLVDGVMRGGASSWRAQA
ncbi:MAG: cell division ATP-binding protein FtsE [Pseudomonadota bacterium]